MQFKNVGRLIADSARELKKPSTLVMLLLMSGLSLLLSKFFNLPINADLRVSFSFIGVMAVGMLFGCVPCLIAATLTDVIGYLIDQNQIRGYSFNLLFVKLFIAFLYGILLYKNNYISNNFSKRMEEFFPKSVTVNVDIGLRSVIMRIIANVFGNIVLNSAVLYHDYQNKSFPFLHGTEWAVFRVWVKPRVEKNIHMLPFECAMVMMILPVINILFTLVCRLIDKVKNDRANQWHSGAKR